VTFSEISLAHLRYNRWATSRVLDEVTPLPSEQLLRDLGGSFHSIYDTVVHLFQADSIWLDRLEGRPTGGLADYAAPGCTFELHDAWTGVLDKMIHWAEAQNEADWSRDLSYKSLAGVSYATPLWQMVLHIVNHGSHHRGQITSMLRQLGVKPVNIDLIGFYRESKAHAS
jgi:uncharacterized damage-inducible protein DinB